MSPDLPASSVPSIVLVGARCSGKTTLGRRLAERLDRPFVDADERLAELAGLPAEEQLARHGEPAFRALEARVLAELSGLRGAVVATGGGAVEQPGFAALAADATVVYLRAECSTLLERQRAAPRARLLPGALRDEIETLLQRRSPLYTAFADVTVPVEGPDPILALLRQLPEA